MTGAIMLALGRGQVLLRGEGVVEVSRALDWVIRIHESRDSLQASAPFRALQQLLVDGASQVMSARADIRGGAVVPASAVNPITAEEAAHMLQLSTRQVRKLAADLEGRRIAGRWTFDRDVVAAIAADRPQPKPRRIQARPLVRTMCFSSMTPRNPNPSE